MLNHATKPGLDIKKLSELHPDIAVKWSVYSANKTARSVHLCKQWSLCNMRSKVSVLTPTVRSLKWDMCCWYVIRNVKYRHVLLISSEKFKVQITCEGYCELAFHTQCCLWTPGVRGAALWNNLKRNSSISAHGTWAEISNFRSSQVFLCLVLMEKVRTARKDMLLR